MRSSPASRFKLGRSAILCVVLAAMVLPASAGATALMISEPGTHGTDHGYRGYDTARYMGAQYEREIVEVKNSWSGINWAGIADPFVDGAIANGLAPFLTLTASPDPANWPSGGRVPAVGTFASVCSEMAQRYNGKVMHYAVWNEPNLVHVGNLGPSMYTALYNACRGAIKAVSPSASVYFGEFSTAPSGWGGLNACQYFRSATPVGSNIVTEGVAIHPYQFAIPPNEQLGTECRGIGRLNDWQSDLANAKSQNALKAAGGGIAPLLISEFGYCAARTPAFPSKPYTPSSGQAACPNNSSGPANVKDEATRATWIAQAFNWAKTHNVLIFNQHTLFKRHPDDFVFNPGGYLWESGIVDYINGTWMPSVGALREVVNPASAPPQAHTDTASNVKIGQATLSAAVDPKGLQTQYRFEYGPSVALGSSTPFVGVGWKASTHVVSAMIDNLSPGTTYYYRITASNAAGTTPGYIHTFTTKRKTQSDVNGDGLGDLVTLTSWKTAYTYPGQSNLEFGGYSESFNKSMDPALFDGTGHYVVDVEDVQGDGYADLVTLMSDGTACVYPGQFDSSFHGTCIPSFNKTMTPGLLTPGGHEPIAVADVTGDGRGDLVTFFPPFGEIFVYKGEANGTFGVGVSSFAGSMDSALFDRSGHYFVDVADVTGDGRADLTTLFTGKYAVVYEGQSSGAFGSPKMSFAGTLEIGFTGSAGHEPIGVADVTGDNRADLVTFFAPTGETYTYPGNPNGYFGAGVTSFAGTSLNSSLFDKTGWELASLLDVNGDTHADLVTSHTGGSVHVYAGTASGAFGTWVPSFGGSYDSSRFDGVGHEMAMEKPSFRRRGCAAGGC